LKIGKHSHLALSTHDAGLGEFQQLLAYKAEESGTRVVTVNPACTSQVCSGCGAMVEKSLSVRVHRCPECGLTLDRDVNAAVNILNLAVEPARTGRSGPNVGGGADYDAVIITGGGGPVIGPLLEPQLGHGDVRIIKEGYAHLANALGALRHRQFKREYS